MKKEIWRDIKGYEGLYQVSNLGRVKSLNYLHTDREQVLRPGVNNRGYLYVVFCKDGKRKQCTVHRLVAEAFIPNPNNLSQVNHKDEDKTNNCVWNLEWCDAKYNINYGTHNKKVSDALKGKYLTEEHKRKIAETLKGVFNTKKSKPLLQINKVTGEVIREWPSTIEVQRQLGYNQGGISMCCLGKCKSAYGFKWSYIP